MELKLHIMSRTRARSHTPWKPAFKNNLKTRRIREQTRNSFSRETEASLERSVDKDTYLTWWSFLTTKLFNNPKPVFSHPGVWPRPGPLFSLMRPKTLTAITAWSNTIENYGFDLQKAVGEYRIEIGVDLKKQAELTTELKDGNRPVVTVLGSNGEEMKLHIEAVPRYGTWSFFKGS